MTRFRVEVVFADGDNWDAQRYASIVDVEAPSRAEARLVAEQLTYTPERGKPEHVQITSTTIVGEYA